MAAIGFVTPLFLTLVGFANGLGAGSNSLIARHIGAEKYESAGNSAIHSIMLSIIVTIITTILILIILKPLLYQMGAGEVITDASNYGYIVMAGSYSLFLPAMLSAIFRSQGKIKYASYPLMYTAIINMILDPIFIYILNLGITGAAIATVIAATIPLFQMIYWMFIKRDVFLKIKMKDYKRDLNIFELPRP